MVEDLGIIKKLKEVNGSWQPSHTFYLYRDLAYYTLCGIIESYKNYFLRP